MFQNDCMECEKRSLIIEDKQKEIINLQQNIFEMKNRIIDTSTLMNSWLICKKENEVLKKELNIQKTTKNVSSEDQTYLKYQFGLLQNKFEKVTKDLESEKYKNAQFSAAHYDDNMGSKELRIELLKVRKQVVEKDKEISELHKMKGVLEKQRRLESNQQMKIVVNEQNEKEEYLQKCQDDENKRYKDESLLNEIHIQSKNEMNNIINKHNISNINDISYKELIEENEFLKQKYQKYNTKYVKFKAKYSETKNFLDLMMQMNILSEKQQSIVNLPLPKVIYPVVANNEISFNLVKNNRISRADSNENSDNSEKILKRKRAKSKDSLKFKKAKEIEIQKPAIEDIIQIKQKPKREKKVFKTDFEKKLEKLTAKKEKLRKKKSPVISTPNTKDESLEGKISPLEIKVKCEVETVQKEFKLPIRKTRAKKDIMEDFQTSNQLKKDSYLLLLNAADSINLQTEFEEYITKFGSNLPAYERTTQLFDLIFTNYIPAKLDRILYLYMLFINKDSNGKRINVFLCLKDYVFSNMTKLSLKLNEREQLESIACDNEIVRRIYQPIIECKIIDYDAYCYLLSHYKACQHLIAYFMIYTVLMNKEYIIEFYKFSKELLFDSIFNFFETIALSIVFLKNLFDCKYMKPFVKSNTMNKIYILTQLSNDFINENLINLINKIVSVQIIERSLVLPESLKHEAISTEELDEFIQTFLISQLKSLNQYILDENKNDKLNFGENTTIVEIYQLLQILMKIKPKEWLNEFVIQNILFKEFISCDKGSLKRIVVIYFVGVLTNFILTAYNYQIEPVKNSMSWLYSILDPQFSADIITFYDKISALSCLLELVKIDPIINQTVKSSVGILLKTHDKELVPIDLQEKLVRFKIVEKFEFK